MPKHKDNHFTIFDYTKELAIYIAECPETKMFIENTREFSPNGVAIAKTFVYRNNLIQIMYDKWIVEGFEYATKMGLPGYEKHNKLIQGSAVRVLSKQINHIFNFYDKDAADIIETCESLHMDEILELTNNLQR